MTTSESDIRNLDHAWAAAEVAGDADALDALAVADFHLVGPLGFVLTRRQWEQRYRSGDLRTATLTWDIESLSVHGDTAVTVGTQTQTGSYRGNPIDGRFRSTHVAVRSGERWLLAGIQLSPIQDPAARPATVELNHTIVRARDREASADFLAGILGLATDPPSEPFVPLKLTNGVTLDYMHADEVLPQHYAFLVSGDVFDAAYQRLRDAGIRHWADPTHQVPGINHRLGGRGVYFEDPDRHNMELLTKAA